MKKTGLLLCMFLTFIWSTVTYAGTFTADEATILTASSTDSTSIVDNTKQCLLTVNKDANVSSVTVKVDSTTISPVTSGGNTYWIDKGSNPTVTATAKFGYKITGGTGNTGAINTAKTVNVSSEPVALKFSSDSNFNLSVRTSTKTWNGTLEYSTNNGNTWNIWNGTTTLSGKATQPIYVRGTGNTVITGTSGYYWIFTGKYITGNIETLLDYQTVANGQHPTSEHHCYCEMFSGCTSLITAPQLPATTLAGDCYRMMFKGCTSLTAAPSLPATTLANSCYCQMFYGCTSLTTAPSLPATTLTIFCYNQMFYGCTSLKLSTTKTGAYKYKYRIPTSNTGTTASMSLDDMFKNTGGTFTGTPTINTTYYTDHQPV